jgi:hypothetical protein
MRHILKALLGMVLLSACAQASPRDPALHNYMVVFHHTAQAFGKPVAAVYAHAGVLMRNPQEWGGEEYWVSIQHVPLEAKGDHLFAKAQFQAQSRPGAEQALGAMVQYWVYFQDGTQLKTRNIPIQLERHVYESWGRTYTDVLGATRHEFTRRQDAARTGGWEITVDPR